MPNADDVLYFAYGSNMRTSRMRRRVSEVQRGKIAHLKGYRRTFDKPGTYGGKTNIRPSSEAGAVVPGVVFALTKTQFDALAAFEDGYDRINLKVQLEDGSTAEVSTFVAKDTKGGLKPTQRYLDHLIAGGREYGFNETEMQEIEKTEVEG